MGWSGPRPRAGDIVVLNPATWGTEYAGRLAMVTNGSGGTIISLADPVYPGRVMHCWMQDLLPWDASLELEAL
jgi:hypothetical protein